jgi:hypothetical protein
MSLKGACIAGSTVSEADRAVSVHLRDTSMTGSNAECGTRGVLSVSGCPLAHLGFVTVRMDLRMPDSLVPLLSQIPS